MTAVKQTNQLISHTWLKLACTSKATRYYSSKLQFTDEKLVTFTSGTGGTGSFSFARSKYLPMGPPSGGNGGQGGSIYLQASKRVTSLNGINASYKANDGEKGGQKFMHGANAPDLVITVPIGTSITETFVCSKDGLRKDKMTIIEEDKYKTDEERELEIAMKYYVFGHKYIPQPDRIAMLLERIPPPTIPPPLSTLDLIEDGEKILVAQGGTGGLGNPHFASPLIPGPRIAGKGSASLTRVLNLELKTLADIGLVGLPNAGKSTLLNALTNTKGKVAPYPFTTLTPYVGMIEYRGGERVSLADIPGIIKNASLDVGLGLRFLRHIQRTRVLVFVVDLSNDPIGALTILKDELGKYDSDLELRKSIIVANKADVPGAKDNLAVLAETGMVVVPVSAKNSVNLDVLAGVLLRLVKESEAMEGRP
jgi:GTPase